MAPPVLSSSESEVEGGKSSAYTNKYLIKAAKLDPEDPMWDYYNEKGKRMLEKDRKKSNYRKDKRKRKRERKREETASDNTRDGPKGKGPRHDRQHVDTGREVPKRN